MDERFDLMKWIVAWEREMANRGYPYARLEIGCGNEGITYSFTHDINHLCAQLYDDDARATWDRVFPKGWLVAHEVFLEVDSARPAVVVPSIMLHDLLCGHRTIDGERKRLRDVLEQ